MKFKVEIKNKRAVITGLDRFGQEVEKMMANMLKNKASEISAEAKRLATVDFGFLRNSITPEQVSELNWKVEAKASYAPYVEFGTGKMVEVPDEWVDLAMQFKGKGIREVNLPARPYMYPAFIKGSQMIEKDTKVELKRLTDKFNR